MNIYALTDHKVVCTTLKGGYPSDEELAMKHLEIGNNYTVLETKVRDWSTNVYLKELPGLFFNSVFFEDVEPQDESDDQFHPDYSRFN